jgi:hypothetical protein
MTSPYSDERFFREVFWSHVNKTGSCWEWMGWTIGKRGKRDAYGAITRQGRRILAHRQSYEWMIGPIPDGLEIDHLCNNPMCVRPDHLKAVTHRENVLRSATGIMAIHFRQSHCKYGHELTVDRYEPKRRRCEVCQTAAIKRYVAKRALKLG